VRISSVGKPNVPAAAAPAAPAAKSAQPFVESANAAAQALELAESESLAGGSFGQPEAALNPIDDIAARASLNIVQRRRNNEQREPEGEDPTA
jgi:hypothetical protein